uniref:Spermatogenesis-defective protein 39 homolog n=1 Tax=Ciona savignyi TaxID=51511 RepID=H2ZPJ0_CIOSA
MRDTLKRDLFSKELMQRQVAVDHYCAYLRAAGEIDELHETLSALGRTEEAAMLKYKQCLASTTATTPEIRASGLKDCVKYYFDCDIRLTNDTQAIQEQISLMQRQSVVEDGDKAAEASGNVPVFKSHPRKESIIYKSLVTTLYYFCYYHWGETEGILSSPTSLRNEHKIGEKQFMFISVAALCKMRRWRDLETMLTTPRTLFRSSRLHAVIGFDKVVDVLSKNLAPAEALAKYCAEIENSEKRLEWAMRLKCYKVTIDTLTHMRDRAQLVIYLDQIPTSNQHMRQYLHHQIRSQDIKWRN